MDGERLRVREIARRAAARALANVGGSSPRADSTGPAGPPAPSRAALELVTCDALRALRDGGELCVAPGARWTPLAREEAWRRSIRVRTTTGARAGASAEGGALRVAVGADHGGFALKERVVAWLRELGHRPLDLGTHDENDCDYPDYAGEVGRAVAAGRAHLGVCVDGAGIGSAMAANKVPGALAANCFDVASAQSAREHNFANVLTLGGRTLEPGAARDILRAFLATPTGAERHARRVAKIRALEPPARAAGPDAEVAR